MVTDDWLARGDQIQQAKNPADLANAIAEYRRALVEVMKLFLAAMITQPEIKGVRLRHVTAAIDELQQCG